VGGRGTRAVGPRVLPGRGDPGDPFLAAGDDLWLRRAAILSQLDHKGSTDVGLLAGTIVANLEGTRFGAEFFIRKAIGWALRQHARVDADWVREFVAEHERDLSGPEQA
jgi:3-methyladenine DNA glycosylase AlkD